MVSASYGAAWEKANEHVHEAKSILREVIGDPRFPMELVGHLRGVESLVDGIFGQAMTARHDLETLAEKYHTKIEELEGES